MEDTSLYFLSVFSFMLILFISKLILKQHKVHRNLPPSPPSLPIIGHLHLIKDPVHRTLQNLSFKYGPIFSLQFGSRPVIVISSPSVAEECFTTKDVILANRPIHLNGKILHYNNTTIGSAPYGPLWRNLRRVATLAMFSNTQLSKYLGIRKDEVRSLTKNLFQESGQSFTKVEMRSRLEELNFNIVMRVIAGKRYFGEDKQNSEEAKHFKDIIADIFEVSGSSDIEDFFPLLLWFDFRGVGKRIRKLAHDSNKFLQSLIDEHRMKDGISVPDTYEMSKTVIDTMLSLQKSEPQYYTDNIIKGMILVLVTAGTDTSAATIEWGMSLLLNHPRVLAKARAELDEYVGQDRLIAESDLPKLQFLQCIVNETLRLFPVGPLLVPHKSSEDCIIGGYSVAGGTMVLVNAWAIHRDPKLWEDSTSFRPERFEGKGGDDIGYKFIPFGMGRRQCPGNGLANKVVTLTLGSLIQCFDWERVGEELVDLSEGSGLTMPKKMPLESLCRARKETIQLLSEL